jgi:hypothetical protein
MKTGTVSDTNKSLHNGTKGQKVTIIKSIFRNGEGHYLTKEIGEIPDMFVSIMSQMLSYNESHLVATILVGRMGFTKSELFSNKGQGFTELINEDFSRFSICHHLKELSKKVIEREDAKGKDFSGCIKSLCEKWGSK